MNVSDLISHLDGLPSEMEVFMYSDPEGNRCWDVDGIDVLGDEDVSTDYESTSPGVYLWPGVRVDG